MTGTTVRGARGRPQRIARLFVQGHQRVFLAAGSANELLAIDQHRFAVTPAVGLFALEILVQVFPPQLLAAGFAADQLAVPGQGINSVAVDRGRATRAMPVRLSGSPSRPDFRFPKLLAVGLIESQQIFVLVGS